MPSFLSCSTLSSSEPFCAFCAMRRSHALTIPSYSSACMLRTSRQSVFHFAHRSGTYLRIGHRSTGGCAPGSRIADHLLIISPNEISSGLVLRGARTPAKTDVATE